MHSGAQSLDDRFEEFIRSADLVHKGDSLLLAVSGGVDSMAMLHLLLRVSDAWKLELGVLHVNHQLRGTESDEDEEFVGTVAQSLKLPFLSKRVDTLSCAHEHHLSKQEAARELRYEFFEQARRGVGSTSVATAHQADDNAETVLLNVLRGTGIRGLAGIPPRRETGSIIRPLLFARRKEIEEYAAAKGMAFRTDSSNESTEYRRNYLRKTVIPLLNSEVHPDIVGSLNRLSQIMRQLSERISHEVEGRRAEICHTDDKGRSTVTISRLVSEPLFLREEIILHLLRALSLEVDAEKVHAILELCSHPTGRSVQLSSSLAVYRDRDNLVFVRSGSRTPLHTQVNVGGRYAFSGFQLSLSEPFPASGHLPPGGTTEYVDAEQLGERLTLRTWKKGDWFIPLGMRDKKKLSDFFTDEKVPLFEKAGIPILESEGEIVWICGKRLDDRFKVTRRTRSVVKLEYSPLPSFH